MKAIIPEQKNESSIQLSLFDINKQIISQQSDFCIEEAKSIIFDFKLQKNDSYYFLLLSKDINYYTVFSIDKNAKSNLEEEVVACLQDWGIIKDIYINDDKSSVECWVKRSDNEEMIYFKLFDYDWGVIECQ